MSAHRSFIGIASLLILILGPFRAAATEPEWLTDYQQALERAKATNRPILMDFTGSDWCPVCIQAEKQVFSKPQFQDYAAKNLVLLRVDFPISKPIPQKTQDQNNHLQDVYGVNGMLPTFILIDKNGKVLVRALGLVGGGPSGFIAMLQGRKS